MRLKKMLILILVVAVVSLLVMLPTSGVYADDFIVTGGTLAVTVHAEGFTTGDSWVIDDVGTALNSSEAPVVTDPTGTNEGWIYTVTFADFTATGISDPSVVAATLSLNVDVEDWLDVDLKNNASVSIDDVAAIPATVGTDIVTANYIPDDNIIGTGNLAILEIEPGYGAGEFGFNLAYTITGYSGEIGH